MSARTTRRFLGVLAAAASLSLTPTDALAGTGPFPRGSLVPSLSAGGGFNGQAGFINVGGGLTYFLVNGLGLGVGINDSIVIYTGPTKAAFPGIERDLPTNTLSIVPNVRYVLPTQRVSPYIGAGVGPVFYNNRNGTLGMWTASAGVYSRLAKVIFLQIGVGVSGQFPDSKYRDVHSYMGSVNCGFLAIGGAPCSLRLSPQFGLSVAFAIPVGGGDAGGKGGKGGKRNKRLTKEEKAATPEPDNRPPPNWGQPVSGEPAPASTRPATQQPGQPEPQPAPVAPAAVPAPDQPPADDERPPPAWGQTDPAAEPSAPQTTTPVPEPAADPVEDPAADPDADDGAVSGELPGVDG